MAVIIHRIGIKGNRKRQAFARGAEKRQLEPKGI